LPCPAVPQDHGGQQVGPLLDSWMCIPLLSALPASGHMHLSSSGTLWWMPSLPLIQTACLEGEEGTGRGARDHMALAGPGPALIVWKMMSGKETGGSTRVQNKRAAPWFLKPCSFCGCEWSWQKSWSEVRGHGGRSQCRNPSSAVSTFSFLGRPGV
jgi:hypothetical protein